MEAAKLRNGVLWVLAPLPPEVRRPEEARSLTGACAASLTMLDLSGCKQLLRLPTALCMLPRCPSHVHACAVTIGGDVRDGG